MSTQKFKEFIDKAVEYLRKVAPRDTGNLAENAIRYEFEDDNTARIYVDQTIAPYMVYTNEPWLSPKWHGKKNPNENWFETAAADIAEQLATAVKGEIVRW